MLHAPLPLAFIAIACAVLPATLRAAPLNLAQSPAALGREPAPNVIVSVDDSGSMGLEGIATLQAALRQTFSAANVPDDRVRLAWQSMNRCRGIPSDSFDCRNQNGMARLSGAHRADFMNWVDRLTHGNNTPSHLMIDEAGKYLSRTDLGVHSPWAMPRACDLAAVNSPASTHRVVISTCCLSPTRQATQPAIPPKRRASGS